MKIRVLVGQGSPAFFRRKSVPLQNWDVEDLLRTALSSFPVSPLLLSSLEKFYFDTQEDLERRDAMGLTVVRDLNTGVSHWTIEVLGGVGTQQQQNNGTTVRPGGSTRRRPNTHQSSGSGRTRTPPDRGDVRDVVDRCFPFARLSGASIHQAAGGGTNGEHFSSSPRSWSDRSAGTSVPGRAAAGSTAGRSVPGGGTAVTPGSTRTPEIQAARLHLHLGSTHLHLGEGVAIVPPPRLRYPDTGPTRTTARRDGPRGTGGSSSSSIRSDDGGGAQAVSEEQFELSSDEDEDFFSNTFFDEDTLRNMRQNPLTTIPFLVLNNDTGQTELKLDDSGPTSVSEERASSAGTTQHVETSGAGSETRGDVGVEI